MSQKKIRNEIVIGIVAPLGSNKSGFIERLEQEFKKYRYHVVKINLTEILFDDKLDYFKCSKKFKLYVKMQFCSRLRETYFKSFLGCLAVNKIVESRKDQKEKSNKNIVYIVDQLKHPAEYELLSHIFGLSYIQISIFSKEGDRHRFLDSQFENDDELMLKDKVDNFKISNYINKIFDFSKAIEEFKNDGVYDGYLKGILPNGPENLIKKDMSDPDLDFSKKNSRQSSGQSMSDIFHLSHYFFNLDDKISKLTSEIDKFLKLLFGKYMEYPTQDEFGMALAYHASYRSTFPHGRHVGACIISLHGEVISVGSIRAPTPSGNTYLANEDNIKEGFENFKDKIKVYLDELSEIEKSGVEGIDEIKKFIKNSLDYHPCSHAEMSSLADAAKQGVSVRGATLYTTTFPCHICAKDIITFGIKKVVYLEQYPKSKNRDLYSKLISFDEDDSKDKIPFVIYCGIGPKRYHYVYELKNRPRNNDSSADNEADGSIVELPKMLKFENDSYYEKREKDVLVLFKKIVVQFNKKNPDFSQIKKSQLYELFGINER